MKASLRRRRSFFSGQVKNSRVQKVKKIILAINVLLVICAVLAFLSPHIHPGKSQIPALMGLIYPLLLLLNCIFVIFWLSVRKWYFLLSLGVLALGYQQIGAFIQFGVPASKANDQPELTVATYNLYGFRKMHTQGDHRAAMKALHEQMNGPDILCVQEALNADALGTHIGMPHVYRIPNCQSTIFSRYPMLRRGYINLKSGPSLSGYADLDVDGDTIRLYLLHLTSNRITQRTEDLMEQGRFQDSDTWVEVGNLLGRYSEAAAVRARQADELREHISSSPHPVIVCGDFNDIPQSYTYATIKGDMRDSFIAKGSGVGATYGGKVPGLRIDYILADRHFAFTGHRVLRIDSSDHYPVVATIRIKDL